MLNGLGKHKIYFTFLLTEGPRAGRFTGIESVTEVIRAGEEEGGIDYLMGSDPLFEVMEGFENRVMTIVHIVNVVTSLTSTLQGV